jgi:hypothetical protein
MAAARFDQTMLGAIGICSKGRLHERISAAHYNSRSSGSQESTLTLNLCQALRAGSVV